METMSALVLGMVARWLVLVGMIGLPLLRLIGVSRPPVSDVPPGRTVRLDACRILSWVISADRAAYEVYARVLQHHDTEALLTVLSSGHWCVASSGQAARIIAVDGGAVQVELLEGPDAGRRGWLPGWHLRW